MQLAQELCKHRKASVKNAFLFPTQFSSSLTVDKSGSWRSWRKNPQGIIGLMLYVAQKDLRVWKCALPLEEAGFHLQSCGREFWSTLRKQLGHVTGRLLCRENLKSIHVSIRNVYLYITVGKIMYSSEVVWSSSYFSIFSESSGNESFYSPINTTESDSL